MALSVSQTAALMDIIKPGMRIASMGYPDLIAPMKALDGLEYRSDSEAICRRHGLPFRLIPDAESFFSLMGCELDVYDIVQERGREILCDLNLPIVSRETYDIVLDVGTIEHCFNIAQTMFNMAGMVKEDGYIMHENPFNWGNHGFYNLNPTFFHDFYSVNGFQLQECKLVTKGGDSMSIPLTQRFQYTASEINIFALAQRKTVQEFVFPMQSKYAAAGPSGEKGVVNG